MDRALDRVARLGAPVLVLLAALVGLLTVATANGFALQHACLPRDGFLGLLGSDFALVRQTADCPASTVAAGMQQGVVVTVVTVLALPVLLSQLAALAVWATASAVTRRVVRRVVDLATAVLEAVVARVRPRTPQAATPERRGRQPWWFLPPRHDRCPAGPRVIRGPPAGALAVA